MRVAVVGPTHPLKGGVAAHTTALAHHLAGAGHDVSLISWSALYPRLLYPGEQAVPQGKPDIEPFEPTTRSLSWARPWTWWRAGRALRSNDLVVVVHVVPAVVPAHLTLLRAARGVPSVVIAHNVLPHEPHVGARRLVTRLLQRAGAVVVHSPEQAQAAVSCGAREVRVAPLPPHLPGGPPLARAARSVPSVSATHDSAPRLLALGIVRDYKGTDLLLEALRRVPGPTLTVAGELWGDAGRRVRRLAASPELAGRVVIREGYVPADELAGVLASHDVLALPYRSATASQNALLARAHGLAVLASRVGSFGVDVRDGVDGLIVAPGDAGHPVEPGDAGHPGEPGEPGDADAMIDALAAALRELCEPGRLEALLAASTPPDLDGPWDAYLDAVLSPT